ncbi:hypothetical protein Syun_013886 [Stephania yunnanensis]|uniref:Uncharacterized protein n=1 Tax=Stephania yunnanensis TaxID=152371 RepID=A0AAP0JI93_9MAGN
MLKLYTGSLSRLCRTSCSADASVSSSVNGTIRIFRPMSAGPHHGVRSTKK